MMNVTISQSQLTQAQSALDVLNVLTKNNIRGSAIDQYITRQGGWKIEQLKSSPSPRSGIIPITIFGTEYRVPGTSMLSVCGFGILSDQLTDQLMLMTGKPMDLHAMGIYLLNSLVEQFKRRNTVKLFIIGREGVIGMEMPGRSKELIHWYGLHIALLCFQLLFEDILDEAAKRREDVLHLSME